MRRPNRMLCITMAIVALGLVVSAPTLAAEASTTALGSSTLSASAVKVSASSDIEASATESAVPLGGEAVQTAADPAEPGELGAEAAAFDGPAAAAGTTRGGPVISGYPQIYDRWVCPAITSRGESTSGIFGRRATIRYQICAYRSRSRNAIYFNTNATQYPGSVGFRGGVESRITVTRSGASSPGYTGRCNAGFIPSTSYQPFFGGGRILRPYFFSCYNNGAVPLSSRLTYKVQGRLCYDVKDDGNGTRCIYSTQYL